MSSSKPKWKSSDMAAPKLPFVVALAVWLVAPSLTAAFAESTRQTTPLAGDTRTIALPHFEPDLPIAPGRDEFMMVCVSCHSPRYVTMQPPFSELQWTETVDKMSKNYGAQMDATQRRAIVGYLVAINGPASWAKASPGDDDEDGWSKPQPPRYVETAPKLPLAGDSTGVQEEIKRGADLFAQDCASCHGPEGRGDGFISQVLLRKAENLAASRYSRPLLSQILWNGKRGTSMPSWRGLSVEDLAALVEFVETLHPLMDSDHTADETLQHGKQLFLHNCVPCHGAAADGNGVNAAALLPPPANFKRKQPDPNYILEVLQNGIPGTAMPSWREQLSEADRRALAGYVRSLFDGTGENLRYEPGAKPDINFHK